VFVHGIGNTLHSWDEVIALMPKDVRIIAVDLLGFGKSPKPTWAMYNAKTQARSLAITLLGLRIVQQPILVGHSLGALVSIDVAKRYSLLPSRLVLCSPPFYSPEADGKKIKSGDDMLRELYRVARKYPERLEKYAPIAVKMGLANKSLTITSDTVGSYIAALEASIINQTSLEDVAQLKLPIDIFYGAFDPVVIKKHITKLSKEHETITATRLLAGHEIVGGYVKSLVTHLIGLADMKER
jgi:pimeloyl-ACP methyl ester carboxylesterase